MSQQRALTVICFQDSDTTTWMRERPLAQHTITSLREAANGRTPSCHTRALVSRAPRGLGQRSASPQHDCSEAQRFTRHGHELAARTCQLLARATKNQARGRPAQRPSSRRASHVTATAAEASRQCIASPRAAKCEAPRPADAGSCAAHPAVPARVRGSAPLAKPPLSFGIVIKGCVHVPHTTPVGAAGMYQRRVCKQGCVRQRD